MMLTPEQLAEMREDFAGHNRGLLKSEQHALFAHIDAQQARIAELEKDAARYRWLRSVSSRNNDKVLVRIATLARNGWSYTTATDKSLDASIDAAMQPTWPEDTSDYGSRIAVIGQNGGA